MTKDELVGIVSDRINSDEGEQFNETKPEWENYWRRRVEAWREIRSILNLHFSISEEERKEARDAIRKQMPDARAENFAYSFIVFKSDDKTIKTILKALGGAE